MGGKRSRGRRTIKGFWGRGECHIWSSVLGRRFPEEEMRELVPSVF
jgi:hypothetical protein